jgi:hypothetical protein
MTRSSLSLSSRPRNCDPSDLTLVLTLTCASVSIAMSTLTLPKSAYPAVQALVGLQDRQFEQLVEVLEESPPSLDPNFADSVAPRLTSLTPSVARKVLEELLTMVYTGSRNNMAPSQLATDLAEAAFEANSERFTFTADQQKTLESRLSKLFAKRGLWITGKAQDVFFDTDKRYFEARVLTDLRPIFDENGEQIAAAAVIHNLRIRYSENGEVKDSYFSVSNADLTALVKVVERALTKEAALSELASKSSIPILE